MVDGWSATEALGAHWERARYRTNRSALNSRLNQNVQHRGATDADLARHVSGRASRLVQLHYTLADTLGRATVRGDGPASGSSGRRTKFNGGVGGVLREGHHEITQVNGGNMEDLKLPVTDHISAGDVDFSGALWALVERGVTEEGATRILWDAVEAGKLNIDSSGTLSIPKQLIEND